MANRGRLLGLAFLLVALLYCSGVLSQGLTLERSVSWPWRSSNTTDIYKPEPFIKGDAGFQKSYKYNDTTYMWLTLEWVGVVRDASPNNVEALVQVLDYNLDVFGPAAPARIFTGVDADNATGNAYFCSSVGSDVWRYNFNTGHLAKIFDRRPIAWRTLLFEPTYKLVWVVADNVVAWINTEAAGFPAPDAAPPANPGDEVADEAFSIVQTIPQVDMRCITRDYKPRAGKQTPYIYIGGSAQVVRTEIQNTAFRSAGFRRQDFELRAIGAGTYNVIGINNARDALYLGSSLGLGIEVDLDQFTLKRLFFAPDDEFFSLIVDRDVTFWGTRESAVYRVNGDTFTVFSSTTVPRGQLRSVVDDGRSLHFGSATAGLTGREFFSYAVRKTNCSFYSCDECFLNDKNYCGVCKSTGLCTLQAECPDSRDIWQQEGLCPASFTVRPVSASVQGESEITITGAFFENPTTHRCVFNYDVPGNAEANPKKLYASPIAARSTTTSLICVVPAYPASPLPSDTRVIQVGVEWTGPTGITRPWGGYLPFTYYSCASLGCSQCFSPQFSDCGWCLSSGSCSTASQCTVQDRFTRSGCPAIRSIAPPYGVVTGGEAVTVRMTNVISTDSYICRFGPAGAPQTDATVASNETISCPTPATSQTVTVSTVPLSILVRNPADVNNPIVHTPSPSSFDFYNCSVFSRCDLCVNARAPRCRWCSTSLTCGDTQDAGFCPDNSKTTSCPVINTLRPNSDYVPAAPVLYQPTQVTIVGANFRSIPNMNCVFQRPNGAALLTLASIPAGSNDIVCSAPNTVTLEEYQVYVAGGDPIVQQTNSAPFLFYDCSGSSCADCIEPRKRLCRWCPFLDTATPSAPNQQFCFLASANRNCSTSTAPSGGEFRLFANCPLLRSVSPDGDALEGGATITLSGDLDMMINQNITYECEWLLTNGSRLRSPATPNVAANTASCSARPASSVQVAQIRLLRNGVGYTNSLPFRFYDCTALGNGCQGCLNPTVYPSCTWCATECTSKAVCSLPKQVNTGCPRILRALPATADVSGGDPVVLEGGPFVASDSSAGYECIWNNVLRIEGQFLDSSRVSCTSPRQSVSNATLSLNYAGVPYAPDSVDIEFFSCSPVPGDSCPDACTAQKHCGWCLTTQTCGSAAKCPSLWLPTCLRPGILQDHANLAGNETIVTMLNGTTFPDVLAEDLRCYFGSGTAGVDAVIQRNMAADASNVSCVAPPSATEDIVEFKILYRDRKLFDDSNTRFAYVDCPAIVRCEDCVIKDKCGWCGDLNSCTTSLFCPLGNWTSGAGACPDIVDVKPLNGDVLGGFEVTITGQYFIGNPQIDLYWDETLLPKTQWRIIDSSTIRVLSAPQSTKADFTIPISLKYGANATRYTVRPGQFTYVDPRAATVRTAIGATAGVVGAILIAIAVFFWYKRRFAGGMIVVVKEPDYVLVAYGSDLEQKYRLPDDNYIKLESALMRQDFGFQMGLSSICPSTEQDAIAKSLVHIAYSHNDPTFVIDMINEAVRAEVASCIQENTIFRGNSIASKMFKFYSRMVGIRYLWRFIARVIAEIETLGRKELIEKQRAEKGESSKKDKEASLLDISMELDEAKMAKGETDIDLDTNLLQLKLTCQKLFSVIVKNSLKDFPTEFRQIFVNIDQCVMNKFQSDDATYKAIGGFFFLRFVCPAITAPHVYGLLDTPPNTLTQRQLVLISKVLQSLANMALPGKKEKYMTKLLDFIESGIPKMGKFYDEIRKHTAFVEGAEYEYTDIGMPPVVKNNGLGTVWNFIFLNQDKTLQSFSQVGVDKNIQRELQDSLEEMLYTYKSVPRKFVAKKTKKGKAAPAAIPE